MRQRKAKALRWAVANKLFIEGILPKMVQTVPYPVYGWVENELTKRREFKQTGTKPIKIAVNHYRNAKRFFTRGKGTKDAIKAAHRYAMEMEACGVYTRVK